MQEPQAGAAASPTARDVSGRGAGGIVWRRQRFLPFRRVAVVRRTRYASQLGRDEWSLPKGHLRGDESSVDAALREVEEETGWRCVVLSEAGALRYRTEKEGPKEVRFWHMRTVCQVRSEPTPNEVAEVAWVSPKKALCMLTYSDQARLLASQAGFDAREPRRTSRRSLFSTTRRARLAASITVFGAELRLRRSALQPSQGTAKAHLDLACELLEEASSLLGSGDLNGGWQAFYGARYHESFALSEAELTLRARALAREADRKLKDSWRGAAVRDLLAGVPGTAESSEPGPPRSGSPLDPSDLPEAQRRVAEAQRLVDDHAGNVYRRLDHTRNQLVVIGLVALPAFVALIALLATGTVSITNPGPDAAGVIYGVVLFGILGGCLSSALSLLKAPADRAIPEVLSYGLTTVFRPMSGAIAALAAYAFLQAGAIGTESPSAAYAVAFAAGFSERIVARAAESIST